KKIKENLYEKSGITMKKIIPDDESSVYEACRFELNNRKVLHRSAKITPAKQGMFVTIWKRNKEGVTVPMDVGDDFDLLLITCMQGDRVGQFVFSKSLLALQKVISVKGKGGKRGMRVYHPWQVVSNTRAKKTQEWQRAFFIETDDAMAKEKFNHIMSQLHQPGSSLK
ncbi:MAG: MepB family protein, partial [Chitinophagaceae bacterium]